MCKCMKFFYILHSDHVSRHTVWLLGDRVVDTPPQTADWWDMKQSRTRDVLSCSGFGSSTVTGSRVKTTT